MDTTLAQAPTIASRETSVAPRIYFLHPLLAGPLEGWGAHFDRITKLGFNHVLIAPPFAASSGGSLNVTADPDVLDPRIAPGMRAHDGIARIAQACRSHGLSLLLDVVLDRIGEDSALARTRPDLFAAPGAGELLDPRRIAQAGIASARGDLPDFTAWWSARLTSLAAAGVSGFRLLGLHSVSAAAAAILAQLKGADLFAWTPGMSAAARDALPSFGYLFGSLPWWDFRAGWFWQEVAALRRHGAIVAATAAPFATAAPADEAEARRAVAFAAAIGSGWMLPMGYEYGACAVLDPAHDRPSDWESLAAHPAYDLSEAIIRANRTCEAADGAGLRLLTAPGEDTIAVLRTDAPEPRLARNARVVLANASLRRRTRIEAGRLLAHGGMVLGALQAEDGRTVQPGETVVLDVGAVLELRGKPAPSLAQTPRDLTPGAVAACKAPRIGIEAITPSVEGGRFPAKRIVGDRVVVEADVIYDGHHVFAAALLWRRDGEAAWQETRMRPLGNDRWTGEFALAALGRYEFTVEAWYDAFGSWRDEVGKKHAAGVDTHIELIEGCDLVRRAAADARGPERAALPRLDARLSEMADDERRALLLSEDVAEQMAAADRKPFRVRHEPALPVVADPPEAEFASWYEVFPRSLSDDPKRHGTFDDVIRHLPRVREMGFDVLYFPPVHPVGSTNKKGRNNSLRPEPSDPGSPYAIGSAEGGHDAINPALGTLDDFRRLIDAAAGHGISIAIDFAIQCSPDHPWLKEHKDWYDWRPDGSLRYAENPPKKYEDIVNVDFYTAGAQPSLWIALANVVLFWCQQGVRLFRVDNPHTKPFPFWEWMIAEVRRCYPDAVFLAEAFTRPKVMYRLGKVGFSQSYTYFTWRDTKSELQAYFTELTTAPVRDFYRPHLFVNTPDINPVFLQTGGRPAHLIRAALATTLSGLWGAYNGFELCEATPLPGREEYLDSEKYQLRAWDWNRPGNIVADVALLNRTRRENPALQTHLNVTFLNAWNEAVMWYEKATPDRSNVILVAVSLDPRNAQSCDCEAPLWRWGLPDDAALQMEELMTGEMTVWRGKIQRLALTPDRPFMVWRARPVA